MFRDLLSEFSENVIENSIDLPVCLDLCDIALDSRSPIEIGSYSLSSSIERYVKLEKFINSFGAISRKFDHIQTSDEAWDDEYVFPDELSRVLDKSISNGSNASIVNDTPASISVWVKNIIRDCHESKKENYTNLAHHLVTGDVGCGKSTLMKKIVRQKQSEFVENHIIITRVEFQKIRNRKDGTTPIDKIRYSIVDSLFREIIITFCPGIEANELEKNYRFSRFFENLKDMYYEFQHIINAKSEYEDFYDYKIKLNKKLKQILHDNREVRKSSIYHLDHVFKESLIKYVRVDLGYEFVVVFDGFDYLTAADLLYETPDAIFISELNEVFAGAGTFPVLESIWHPLTLHHVLVMRDVSHARFASKDSRTTSNGWSHNRVVPPSSFKLSAVVTKRVFKECGVEVDDESILRFVSSLRRHVRHTLFRYESIQPDLVLRTKFARLGQVNVFNGNARKELIFTKFLLELIVREFLPQTWKGDGKQYEPKDLLWLPEDPLFQRVLKGMQYRILATFMCKSGKSFQNSFGLAAVGTQSNLTPINSVFETEGVGNFIDNIFNYDLSENSELSFIGKVRICELLDNSPMTMARIQRRIEPAYFVDLERVIYIMCKAGWLRATQRPEGATYVTEPLGKFCYRHLSTKTEYLEQIFPYTAFPSVLADLSITPYVREDTNQKAWAEAAIARTFIFFKFIKLIEKKEKNISSTKWSQLHPRILENHRILTVRSYVQMNKDKSISIIDWHKKIINSYTSINKN